MSPGTDAYRENRRDFAGIMPERGAEGVLGTVYWGYECAEGGRLGRYGRFRHGHI
jgi:hypothetical protein